MAKKNSGKPEVNPVDGTLNPEPSVNFKADNNDPAVLTVLQLIENNFDDKRKQDEKNEKAYKEAEECMKMQEPEGARRTQTMLYMQTHQRTISRTKPLDYTVHGVGATRSKEMLVFYGVETVLRRGGYYTALMSKGGALPGAIAIGDGWILMSTKKEGFPFKFTVHPNNNVYFNTKAVGMRTGSSTIRQMALIVKYKLSEYNAKNPDWKGKVGVGKIPRKELEFKDVDQTALQALSVAAKETEEVEELHFFDLDALVYMVAVGPGMTITKKLEGEEFPFKYTNPETQTEEAYIPMFHTMGTPAFQGFFNHGVFHWIYTWATAARQLFNKVSGSISSNADAPEILSVPKGQASSVFGQLKMGAKQRAKGKRPVVAVEYDPTNPGGNAISLNRMSNPVQVSEAEFVDRYITREIKRMGITLDEVENPINELHILSEEENSNMFVKQLQEYNAPEIQVMLDIIIDQLPKVVTPNKTESKEDENGVMQVVSIKQGNKTPILLATPLRENGKDLDMKSITLGALAEELKIRQYYSLVNSRSGAISSKARQARINKGLSQALPGSKARTELLNEFAIINNLDVKGEDFIPAPQQAPAGAGGPEGGAPQEEPIEPTVLDKAEELF